MPDIFVPLDNLKTKNGKLIRRFSAVPPPHPKQQSTTVFFKFEQVTPQTIDWRLDDQKDDGNDYDDGSDDNGEEVGGGRLL